ncbi:MAG: tyrosine recombinase [bacterium]|nr:tyrosine recombinase [bacterium]
MNEFDIICKNFLDFLDSQKNYSHLTIENYKEDLNFFENYLKKEQIDFKDIIYSDIKGFYNYLETKKYSKNTIARHISALRSFYKYLAFNKIIKSNPFSLATLPKKDKLLPKFLYYNELEEMFNVIPDKTPLDKRNRCILELLYATGVRVSELVNIKLDDINFSDMSIKVLGKGNKERIVYYGSYASFYLEEYLNNSRNLLLKDKTSDYLLINSKGFNMTTRSIELIIKDIITKTSIKSNITPHTIRHTFATHLLNEGCDILSVQELLGHESLKATQIYTHITNDELKNIYLNCHPRNKK